MISESDREAIAKHIEVLTADERAEAEAEEAAQEELEDELEYVIDYICLMDDKDYRALQKAIAYQRKAAKARRSIYA